MKILVSNIGSTSFKFRLFEMDGRTEREIASGGADRIGQSGGTFELKASAGATLKPAVAVGLGVPPTGEHPQAEKSPLEGGTHQSLEGGTRVGARESAIRNPQSAIPSFADHAAAIKHTLAALVAAGVLADVKDLGAVAFKAVMAGDFAPVAWVDDALLERMEYFVPVAPAHNPPYIAAMRMFRRVLAGTPLVAAFEPGFHQTVPNRRKLYAVPPEWATRYGIRRYGFHGASHRYIAWAMSQRDPAARRIISCHLGGSSSLCAIRDGQSAAVSMGLSPQSGLPQSNRAGDFDAFALPLLERQSGLSTQAALKVLGGGSGLAALSGTSGDLRDIERAAGQGEERSKLTLDVFVTAIRDYLGAYLVELGGADAVVFTGGIGQKSPTVRAGVCRGLEFAGVAMDESKNTATKTDGRIDADSSKCAIWVMATNEELIVARQAMELLNGSH